MIQLKELYDGNGNKRMYREDQYGRLRVFYQDDKEDLIIRDFFEEDAAPWVIAMTMGRKLTAKQRNQWIKQIKEKIRARKEEDLKYSLLVTTSSGKIVGNLDVYPGKEDPMVEAEIDLILRNQPDVKQNAESLIKTICNLHKKHAWYDKIFIR